MSRLDRKPTEKFEWTEATNNGYDIFRNEIGSFTTTKNILNPLKSEKHPSARIKQSSVSSMWLLYTYNEDGKCYTGISFLMAKYGFTFKEAIEHIKNKYVTTKQAIIKEEPKIIKPSEIFYEVNKIPFKSVHEDYYCVKGTTEEFLNKEMGIFAIDAFALNKEQYFIPKNQFAFAYEYRDENGNVMPGQYKILRLGRVAKANKWRTNILPTALFYTYKIQPDTKQIWIVKANKDCVPLAREGIVALATMSENRHNIIQALIPLMKQYPDVEFIVNMGSDIQGFETSKFITEELGCNWFNIPKALLTNDVNDNWSYVINYGMESFKQLLKNKNYI